tara:strand:+ start:2184 stop:2690 length:507 start_codon:yes stop_codon:yes gene_type:complete
MQILNNYFFAAFLPIFNFFIIIFLFFIFQAFSKKRIFNMILTILFNLILNTIFFYLYQNFYSNFFLTYITLTLLMNIYIFINLIQLPVSSIQINMLKIINKYKSIDVQDLKKKYNNNIIFNLRYKRLKQGNFIQENKKKINLSSKFLLIILNIFLFLRLITNQKNNAR